MTEDRPWWERVSDPDPKVREQAHIEGELEASEYYPHSEPESEPEPTEEE